MVRISLAWLMAASVLCTAPLFAAQADEKDAPAESLEKVREDLQEERALIIDVREPREWKSGHLSQARLISLTEMNSEKNADRRAHLLADRLPEEKDVVLYTYCQSGVRSFMAAELLKPLGYEVRPLRAGYPKLVEFGFPHIVPDELPKRKSPAD